MVTRAGSKNSGIRASVQSWSGSIITELWEKDGETYYSIEMTQGSSNVGSKEIQTGKLSDLIK